MKKKLLFAVCFFLGVCFCMSVASVSNAFIFDEYQTMYCYPNLTENKTSDIGVLSFQYFSAISEVVFEPWKAGTWKLRLYGITPLWYKIPSGVVQVSWKDYNGDRKWHVFTERNVNFPDPIYITLYSGSPSIAYRIRLASQADVGGVIKITPILQH